MNNTALIVIDMQEGLLQRQVYNKQALIENINRLIDLFHSVNSLVILSRHTNSSFSKENTDEWQLCSELRQIKSDCIINKSHSSVFDEKQFKELLADKNIHDIVVTGLVSNGCVQVACSDAKKSGFTVTLISDAHSTWQKDAEKVISQWNEKLAAEGIKVSTTEKFLLSSSAAP
jgi:nicotinamidase-related amidase